jgi:Gluconate 2-dehydrogenase subunit 3
MESRRGLLKKTIGGAILLAGAGAVPIAMRKTKLREPPHALKFFTPAEYSIWAAVADRVLADPEKPAPTPAQVDVTGKADAFLSLLSEGDAKELKQLLALFDNALFSFVGGGPAKPFTQMDAQQQDQQLRDWQNSRLAVKRTGFQAMKRLCCAIYFGSPETYASVGYPGPPYELVKSVLAR